MAQMMQPDNAGIIDLRMTSPSSAQFAAKPFPWIQDGMTLSGRGPSRTRRKVQAQMLGLARRSVFVPARQSHAGFPFNIGEIGAIRGAFWAARNSSGAGGLLAALDRTERTGATLRGRKGPAD